MTDKAEKQEEEKEKEKEEEIFPEEETAEIKTEVEPEKTEEKSEEKTEEKPAESEKEEKPEEPISVPIAALHDKRRQVDQLKKENEELRLQLPPTEAPDAFEDLEAHDAFVRDQAIREMTEEQNRIRLENIEVSRSKMLEKHPDYYEMENIFELMVLKDPALAQQMLMSGDEAQFAYNKALEYKSSIMGKAEVKTEKQDETAVDAPSLATATAQASNLPQKETELAFGDEMFEDQKY